uniref:Uncharacterized protein n=1 Tax=Arundo donax TaxID=35708 RepID=A0A0A9FKW4_ARUDO
MVRPSRRGFFRCSTTRARRSTRWFVSRLRGCARDSRRRAVGRCAQWWPPWSAPWRVACARRTPSWSARCAATWSWRSGCGS